MPSNGIPPGTKWEDLPDDWICPVCGGPKSAFNKMEEASKPVSEPAAVPSEKPIYATETKHEERKLSPVELSVICSNLARGCEKQYLFEESEKFTQLADFFMTRARPVEGASMEELLQLINNDLSDGFPYATEIAETEKDRGALRALTWSLKATRMLQSLLERYEQEGERMLENTNVWVCTICGFVYVGDNPPDICPVCKVPGWKFERVGGE